MPSKLRSGNRPSQDRTDRRDTRETIGLYIYIGSIFFDSVAKHIDRWKPQLKLITIHIHENTDTLII